MFITDEQLTEHDNAQEIVIEGFEFIPFYEKVKNSKKKEYIMRTDTPAKVFKALKKETVVIKAAGGLVANADGEYLFIFRNAKWDLPKGKVETDEKVKFAAVREVEEECGVTVQTRNERICKTYHIYEMKGEVVLKKTSWYHMSVAGNPKLTPQVEEGITEVVWVAPKDIAGKLTNTYPSIVEVLKGANLIA